MSEEAAPFRVLPLSTNPQAISCVSSPANERETCSTTLREVCDPPLVERLRVRLRRLLFVVFEFSYKVSDARGIFSEGQFAVSGER